MSSQDEMLTIYCPQDMYQLCYAALVTLASFELNFFPSPFFYSMIRHERHIYVKKQFNSLGEGWVLIIQICFIGLILYELITRQKHVVHLLSLVELDFQKLFWGRWFPQLHYFRVCNNISYMKWYMWSRICLSFRSVWDHRSPIF